LSRAHEKSFMPRMAGPTTEEFPERIRRLAKEHRLSLNKLANSAWDPNIKGTGPDMFKKALHRKARPSPILIEALAGVLGTDPQEFAEYRLAVMRHLLDEHEVGLDRAVANAKTIEEALSEPALSQLGLASAQAAQGARQSEPSETAKPPKRPASARRGHA
jgi:transcriptional regulator with XRE-family HTH domain